MEAPDGTPAELSCVDDTPPPAKKPRAVRWLEAEEKTLIDEVLEREGVLFGELKGVGIKSIGRRRNDAWSAIADILSV